MELNSADYVALIIRLISWSDYPNVQCCRILPAAQFVYRPNLLAIIPYTLYDLPTAASCDCLALLPVLFAFSQQGDTVGR